MAFEDDTWQAIQTKVLRGAKPPRWRRKIIEPQEAVALNFWTDQHQQEKCFTWRLVGKGDEKELEGKPTELWHPETPLQTYTRMQRSVPGECGPLNMYDEEYMEVLLQHLGTPRQQATGIHLYKCTTPYLVRCVNRARALPRETKKNAIVTKLGYLLRIRGIRSVAPQHVRVPKLPDLEPDVVRQAITRAIRQSPVEDGRQTFWLDNLNVHATAEPSFHRYARGHRQVAKAFDPRRKRRRHRRRRNGQG